MGVSKAAPRAWLSPCHPSSLLSWDSALWAEEAPDHLHASDHSSLWPTRAAWPRTPGPWGGCLDPCREGPCITPRGAKGAAWEPWPANPSLLPLRAVWLPCSLRLLVWKTGTV